MNILAYVGFVLAAYSVIANDVIQTLGTFLASNKNKNWVLLWLFAGGVLSSVLIYGWYNFDGDVSYGRLSKIPFPTEINILYLLPPVCLLIITRIGIPISTTFMILTVFSAGQIIEKMVLKSILGYGIAFIASITLYYIVAKQLERPASLKKLEKSGNEKFWYIGQWLSTGFLWVQWLIQDFANIYVYLPRALSFAEMIISLSVILLMLAIIFKQKGGKIQEVVTNKTNAENIRSATIIDLCYGLVLFVFTEINSVPMSTTWTFIGILAGREIAIRTRLKHKIKNKVYKIIFWDLTKVMIGLVVSVILAYLIIFINA